MTREQAIQILKYNSNVIHKTINGETDPNEVEALNMGIEALQEKSNILSEYEKLVDSLEDVTPKEASKMVDDFCITTMRKMLSDHYSKVNLAHIADSLNEIKDAIKEQEDEKND